MAISDAFGVIELKTGSHNEVYLHCGRGFRPGGYEDKAALWCLTMGAIGADEWDHQIDELKAQLEQMRSKGKRVINRLNP